MEDKIIFGFHHSLINELTQALKENKIDTYLFLFDKIVEADDIEIMYLMFRHNCVLQNEKVVNTLLSYIYSSPLHANKILNMLSRVMFSDSFKIHDFDFTEEQVKQLVKTASRHFSFSSNIISKWGEYLPKQQRKEIFEKSCYMIVNLKQYLMQYNYNISPKEYIYASDFFIEHFDETFNKFDDEGKLTFIKHLNTFKSDVSRHTNSGEVYFETIENFSNKLINLAVDSNLNNPEFLYELLMLDIIDCYQKKMIFDKAQDILFSTYKNQQKIIDLYPKISDFANQIWADCVANKMLQSKKLLKKSYVIRSYFELYKNNFSVEVQEKIKSFLVLDTLCES